MPMGKASGLSAGTTAFRVAISVTCAFFIALERSENAVNIEVFVCSQHALFRRCLSFKTLLLMASGVDLGARRASIMSISWGGLWAIGGSVVGSLQGLLGSGGMQSAVHLAKKRRMPHPMVCVSLINKSYDIC